jgi:hypothetical protein
MSTDTRRGRAPLALLLALVMVFASGCSVKMAYNNMDRLARWGMSDYVDMTPEQREYFDAEVASILYWHRTQHLPRYAAMLESLEVRFSDGTTVAELRTIGDEMFVWYEEIEDKLVPMGVEMLLSLDDEQVAELPRKLSKDNEELAEDEADMTPEEIQERWRREFQDGFSRFVGRLTKEQKAYLEEQAVNYIPQYALWADYRRRWQADVMKLIREGRADPDQFEAEFRALLAARKPVYYGAELTAVFDHNEKHYQEVTVWLLNHLNERQRETLFTRTRELAEAFRELVAEAPEAPPAETVCLVRC